jgi:L-threonylcarbamoyladenylate synthase
MIIVDYSKKYHRNIIKSAAKALKQGKAVAYPTDTSYGLAVDATNIMAIKKLYSIKGRNFSKPVHVVVPSISYLKRMVRWNTKADKLAKRFWPGALTTVSKLKIKNLTLKILSADTGFLGVRMPKNKIAQDLSRFLNHPITTTSANVSGQKDCYSIKEIIAQFKSHKIKPDIIINAGKLPKRKPSTVVKIAGGQVTVLREGPISQKQISEVLGVSF